MLIIEGVDKLENEFICLKPGKTNCYILKGGNGYLLIDTGYESDYKSFLKQLKDYHIGLDEIKYLLLTHHHDDHVGFANKLLDDTDLKIISYKYSKKLLKEGKNDKSRGGGIINKRMYFVFKFGQWFIPNLFGLTFPTISLRNKDILLNGDNLSILREIGIEGDILYTPGHSIDSISVLLDDGSIFCGDMAANFPDWLGTRFNPPFLTDVKKNYQSWEKIINTKAKTVYPSHGKDFNIERLKDNLDEFKNEDLIGFF